MTRKVFFLCFLISLFLTSFNLVFATNLIKNPPGTMIEGKTSGIVRPEGIAFTRTDDFVAIANYHGDSILFYQRVGNSGAVYETTPTYIIKGPESQLYAPHDLCFSPDGNYLAVANRNGNSVTIYKKKPDQIFFDSTPIAVIHGKTGNMLTTNAVKYAPQGNIIAVADVAGDVIALYHYQDEKYDEYPYQLIHNSSGILYQLDGLAFSNNGKLLAVTGHATHAVLIYQQLTNSSNLYSSEPVEIIQGKQTNLCFPHSLCFSSSDDLVVSCAGGKKTLNLFKKLSDNSPRYSTTPEQSYEIYNPNTIHLQAHAPEEGGVKGIAFSTEGNTLGLCSSDIANSNKMILIYSLSSD